MGSVTYQVRCTEAIAKEMARYESSTIIGQEDEQRPAWVKEDNDEKEIWTTYLFTLTSKCVRWCPVFGRWASFGCTPQIIG